MGRGRGVKARDGKGLGMVREGRERGHGNRMDGKEEEECKKERRWGRKIGKKKEGEMERGKGGHHGRGREWEGREVDAEEKKSREEGKGYLTYGNGAEKGWRERESRKERDRRRGRGTKGRG